LLWLVFWNRQDVWCGDTRYSAEKDVEDVGRCNATKESKVVSF